MRKKTIISYNVNGIRAALRKGFGEWVAVTRPDILCLQEIKATPDQIDLKFFENLGYNLAIHPAQKKGYSGVMTMSLLKPGQVIVGMNIIRYDTEGRVLVTVFDQFAVVNVYFPSGSAGDHRQDFKMQFLNDFGPWINELRTRYPRLLICGDFNICHKPIDINHPERHKKSSGFLPGERAWFDDLLASGMTDTFRMYNQLPDQYSWWSYRAGSREKNLGWRIDYHIVSEALVSRVCNAEILADVVHSDHCPVQVYLEL